MIASCRQSQLVCVDTETVGCDPRRQSPVGTAKLFSVQMAWRPGPGAPIEVWARRWAGLPQDERTEVIDVLQDPAIPKVLFNVWGFDLHAFRNEGIELRGVALDGTSLARACEPGAPAGLKDLEVRARLGRRPGFAEIMAGHTIVEHHVDGTKLKGCGTRALPRLGRCDAVWGGPCTQIRWGEDGTPWAGARRKGGELREGRRAVGGPLPVFQAVDRVVARRRKPTLADWEQLPAAVQKDFATYAREDVRRGLLVAEWLLNRAASWQR